jgi:hypothetical protein
MNPEWVRINIENIDAIASPEMRERVTTWLERRIVAQVWYRRISKSGREIVYGDGGVAGFCEAGKKIVWGFSNKPSGDGERWYITVRDDEGTSYIDEDGDFMCEHWGCFKKAKWRSCDGRPTCGEFSPL